jgi:hypothetical protein
MAGRRVDYRDVEEAVYVSIADKKRLLQRSAERQYMNMADRLL